MNNYGRHLNTSEDFTAFGQSPLSVAVPGERRDAVGGVSAAAGYEFRITTAATVALNQLNRRRRTCSVPADYGRRSPQAVEATNKKYQHVLSAVDRSALVVLVVVGCRVILRI